MSVNNNLTEIILQRLNQNSKFTDVGLLSGLAGESLYYFYRNHLFDEEASYEKAVTKLHEAIGNNASHTTFYNGIAGIGWMISHLDEAGIIEVDVEDFLDTSIESFLYQEMIKHLDAGIYDFFFGASGICYYFISRYNAAENKDLKETYKNYITHFLFYMEYIGINNINGMHWKHSYYPFENDDLRYQLSSEANVSAVIMILVEIVSLNDFNSISIPLLQKSSNWLLKHLKNTQNIRIDQAFCLWKTGSVLESATLKEETLQLLRDTTSNLAKENIVSLFRHALIYHKVAVQNNDAFFAKKASEAFNMASIAFSKENNLDASIWKGNAGIGLTDLTLTHKLNIDWAKCMLI